MVLLVLSYCLSIVPAGSGRIAFQLDSEKRQAIQKDYEINPLVFLVPNLLHNREVILFKEPDSIGVEYGRRLRIHEIKRSHTVEVDAVPQHADESASADVAVE